MNYHVSLNYSGKEDTKCHERLRPKPCTVIRSLAVTFTGRMVMRELSAGGSDTLISHNLV